MLKFRLAHINFKGWIIPVLVAFLALHNPDGSEVLVKKDEIIIISPSAKGEHKACSRIMMHGIYYWIKECPDDIKKAQTVNLW